ncbi:Aminoglycoside/hydroxyurea antibiotic resistance kinase [Legionella nautarum]|uniref:Aminoglycoside/hydroxyurea antibiotic resistance kinase n=1 Tax=Legionella nautarum TaxID=45070 RepID=A0A0W0X3T4_9GAMM|nr:aminoglycoside phosphotransferase family protein [Legionella nautarum]KTD39244.1 Aminoglycoside/hydroxyurea antibiotic resistance kinase [Legionella nautarum]
MFECNIISIYGEQGKKWLAELPNLSQELADLWQLNGLKPMPNLSYSYVLAGLQKEKPIILKLSLDAVALSKEAKTLRAFNSGNVVEVLAETKGALLLQRAVPGYSLKSYWPNQEKESVEIACLLISQLVQAPLPEKEVFPSINHWLSILDKDWDIPELYLQRSRELRDYLLKTGGEARLLHGDLHHDNILKNGENWLAIDPKGIVGELSYEVAAFIRNPIPELLESETVWRIIDDRIIRFAFFLKLDPKRIRQWCFVQAVLAWCWSIEDGLDTSYFRKITEIFAESVF